MDAEKMREKAEVYRRSIGKWRIATFIFFLLTLGLLVAVLIVAFVMNRMIDEHNTPYCGKTESPINLDEPTNPSVFHDLTTTEIDGIMSYLYSQKSLNLVKPWEAKINTSYIFTAEIYLPGKQTVLHFLDHGSPKPKREAIVTIFRGDEDEPYVKELIVGPLPNPTYMNDVPGRKKKIPFIFRPFTTPELVYVNERTVEMLHSKAATLLKESFGGSLKDCVDNCLTMQFPVPISPAISGENKRMTWMNMEQKIEYFGLHPVDFAVLSEIRNMDVILHQVWYNGQLYDNLDSLVQGYQDGSVKKIAMPFPGPTEKNYGKMETRGEPFQEKYEEDPIQVEPNGKRYTVKHNHVEYRGWSFDYRMSTTGGPQLYDIRYRGERIVYELSLQEIMVMYSGDRPSQMFADYFDTCTLLGMQAKGLVPGVDCPAQATFINVNHVTELSTSPVTMRNVLCLFEWNTGMPLRRHNGLDPCSGGFYEGVPSVVFTLRTAYTVVNYDYIFDFIFFQNGVIQVKAVSTGYIMANIPNPAESPYGMQLQKYLTGTMHLHTFNFKADIDIKGTINRYETLDITPTSVPNKYFPKTKTYHMTNFTRNVMATELSAVYKFNFEEPKYLIFYNEQSTNLYGNPKAYRIMNTGMAKQLFAEGKGNEPSASWARYQLAVTKHNDTERTSSSMYAYLDATEPVVRFQNYLDDDENIVDQDLVAWVTLGVHHIPHTEDLPVTPSPGMDLSFYLLPYNFFPEDPAMASRHAVRMELKDMSNPFKGFKVIRYKPEKETECLAPKNKFFDMVQGK